MFQAPKLHSFIAAIFLGHLAVSCGKPLVNSYDITDLQRVKKEIAGYKDVANQIMDFIVNGSAKGQAYDRLALFTDTFGSRFTGSQNLENSIDLMLNQLKKDGLDNVHGETVKVPHWVRGNESAMLLEPRGYNLIMMGLGSSVGTPPGGITAEAIVVSSFDELQTRANEVPGKIVVFNQPWVNYGVSVAYRDFSAVHTAKLGGVASLVRSVASFSIHSPHTGWQDYSDGVKKIPVACLAVEDAEMLVRMAARGLFYVFKAHAPLWINFRLSLVRLTVIQYIAIIVPPCNSNMLVRAMKSPTNYFHLGIVTCACVYFTLLSFFAYTAKIASS